MNVLNFDLISSSSLTQGDVQHIMWISRHLNSAWFIYRWKLPSICYSPFREARLPTVTLPQPTAACKSTWRHMAWKIPLFLTFGQFLGQCHLSCNSSAILTFETCACLWRIHLQWCTAFFPTTTLQTCFLIHTPNPYLLANLFNATVCHYCKDKINSPSTHVEKSMKTSISRLPFTLWGKENVNVVPFSMRETCVWTSAFRSSTSVVLCTPCPERYLYYWRFVDLFGSMHSKIKPIYFFLVHFSISKLCLLFPNLPSQHIFPASIQSL